MMANTADDMPSPNRSASEIEFVLRNAKRRRGHEVLRDLAQAGAEPAPIAKARTAREEKPRRQAARKR